MNEPFDSAWKEKSFKKMKDSGNLSALYDVFNKTQQLCGTYFNSNVFVSFLYEYYNGKTKPTVSRLMEKDSEKTTNDSAPTVVKKVKKIVS